MYHFLLDMNIYNTKWKDEKIYKSFDYDIYKKEYPKRIPDMKKSSMQRYSTI